MQFSSLKNPVDVARAEAAFEAAWDQIECTCADARDSRLPESGVLAENDRDWNNTQITLEIRPHPALLGTQAKVIALDYGMRGRKAKIKVRPALLYYAARRLGLDTDPSARKPEAQQIERARGSEQFASSADLQVKLARDIVQ